MQHLIIVDAYNLILRSPLLRPEEGRTMHQAREKLLNMLSWVVGPGEARFLVVFDGARGGGRDWHQGRVDVRYSRPPQKADDLIRALVDDQVERVERVTVVSADVEVARHARAMGADIALSDLFLSSVLGPAPEGSGEKPATLSRKELEEWAEIFRTRQGRGTGESGATEAGEERDPADPAGPARGDPGQGRARPGRAADARGDPDET